MFWKLFLVDFVILLIVFYLIRDKFIINEYEYINDIYNIFVKYSFIVLLKNNKLIMVFFEKEIFIVFLF